jgi:DNA-binding NarL/FixJ family response regulator
MTRIFIIEEHTLLRQSFHSFLKDIPEVQIIGEAPNFEAAIPELGILGIDILLFGLTKSKEISREAVRYLKGENKDIKLIALLTEEKYAQIRDLMNEEVKGFIHKKSGKDDFLMAIKRVANGELFICTETALLIFDKIQSNRFLNETGKKPKIDLSKREKEVLALIATGCTNIEIADKIFASKRTVESIRKNLLEKTEARNTAELMVFSLINNLISIDI